MTREETVKVMGVLQTAYPMFYRNQTQAQAQNTVMLCAMLYKVTNA